MHETVTNESQSSVPGRGRVRLVKWIRETISTIVSEVTDAILEEGAPDPPGSTFRVRNAIPSLCVSPVSDTVCTTEMIDLLSNDSTYLDDPLPHEREEFESYPVQPNKVRELLLQFPSLQMRIDHYKMTVMNDEGEMIIRRILFKLEKLRNREANEDGLVVVSNASTVLVEGDDSADFVPLSED